MKDSTDLSLSLCGRPFVGPDAGEVGADFTKPYLSTGRMGGTGPGLNSSSSASDCRLSLSVLMRGLFIVITSSLNEKPQGPKFLQKKIQVSS